MAAGGWLLRGQIGALSAVIARSFLPAILVLGAGLLLVKLGRAMTPSAGQPLLHKERPHTMQISLRPWTVPDDLRRIAEIQSANWWGPVALESLAREHEKFPADGRRHRLVAVWVPSGQVVGFGSAWRLPYDEAGRFQVRVMVDPACRRQGLGTALLNAVEQLANADGATAFESRFRDDEGMLSFAQAHGYTMEGHHTPYKLDLATFDETRFAAVVAAVEAAGVQFVSMAEPKDEGLERSVYELEAAASKDEPGFEEDPFPPFDVWKADCLEAASHPREYFMVAVDPPGKAVAMTAWHTGGEGNLWARFTCVHRDWRGRGLSTAVKVKLILAARAAGLVSLSTGSDTRNSAMINVNRALGYVPIAGGMYRCLKGN